MSKRKISDRHPKYREFAFKWRRIRDFLDGRDALIAHDISLFGKRATQNARLYPASLMASGAYVPPLESQTISEYFAYLNRGEYDNWPQLTLNQFTGLIVQDGVQIEGVPDPISEDCDLQGTPLEEAIEDVIRNVLSVNRAAWLIDRPSDVDGMSKADAETAGIRPYLVKYDAEQVIYWRIGRVGSRVMLVEAVLAESTTDADGKPDFEYRQLIIEPVTINEEPKLGYVHYRWTRTRVSDEYSRGPASVPLMGNEPLPHIPIYFFDAGGGKVDPQKPTMNDLTMLALAHWQSSVDLRHAAFAVALPTASFHGYPDEFKPVLGGLNVNIASNPDANESFLELTGQGLDPLMKIIDAIEARIGKFGGRMLADEKKDAETSETVRIRSSGESATLADVARSVSRIASQALTFMNEWGGSAAQATVTLNTDYTAKGADSAMVGTLEKAVVDGKFTQSDFNEFLRRSGIVEADRTDGLIASELEAEAAERERKAQDMLAAAAANRAEGAA